MTELKLRKILMVEDDPDIQAVSRLVLEGVGGFTVETCNDGFEAVDKAPRFGPDLILLDVMMPGMDGPETLKALRGISSIADVPVLFMTARVQQHEVEQYKMQGAIDVIAKPFDPMTLSDTITTIWERHNG